MGRILVLVHSLCGANKQKETPSGALKQTDRKKIAETESRTGKAAAPLLGPAHSGRLAQERLLRSPRAGAQATWPSHKALRVRRLRLQWRPSCELRCRAGPSDSCPVWPRSGPRGVRGATQPRSLPQKRLYQTAKRFQNSAYQEITLMNSRSIEEWKRCVCKHTVLKRCMWQCSQLN